MKAPDNRYYGARGGRTLTVSPPTDFKSVASADSAIAPGRYILHDEGISSSVYAYSGSTVFDHEGNIENQAVQHADGF